MEDSIEYMPDGSKFVRRFVSERSDPYFLQLQRGYEEIERSAVANRSLWRLIGPDTYEQSIEPEGNGLQIHGIASTPIIDSHRQAIDSKGIEAELPIPLISEHTTSGSIGSVFYLRRSPTSLYMRACLHDHFAAKHAESLIKNGSVSCLSIAPQRNTGRPLATVDGVRFFSGIGLAEISICQSGANADARFEILRKGDDGRKFWASSSSPKAEPRIPYRGPWKETEQYQPGDFVSHQGGLWHGEIESKGVRPNESPMVWRLAVKRGDAEKMERRHEANNRV
ncbi:hypothetical protein LB557_31430 [Mesorhizobium sp. BR115XR7A]|uniref:HK97 family phage prohead protease n=1 Tax=Mesorhizobium sp. BR115XR7A TaxID=2876645 RepID=UPI001CCD62A4|nr:hypothetical protein [Mesorhizobium sp. BR115XR7A]MBZ9910486.1 hypothetical protein [Mesorhizobium sp. BR115XR7A]MBZ9933463.1 hypothetical protein [Mesorhizobium sp. BR1-1-5]